MNALQDAWVLYLHILSGAILLGGSFFHPLVLALAARSTSWGELIVRLDLGRRTAAVNPAASLAVLATGFLLGRDGWWTAGWFWVATGAWLLNSVLAVAVVQRAVARVARQASSETPGPVRDRPGLSRRFAAARLAQFAMAANDLALLFLMITTPATSASLLVVGTANAAITGPAFLRLYASRASEAAARFAR